MYVYNSTSCFDGEIYNNASILHTIAQNRLVRQESGLENSLRDDCGSCLFAVFSFEDLGCYWGRAGRVFAKK